MASGALDSEGRFVEAGQSFPSTLLGSPMFFLTPGQSSCLPGILGTEVDDVGEGSWSQCYEALALLGR
jgi:hypothetical protein